MIACWDIFSQHKIKNGSGNGRKLSFIVHVGLAVKNDQNPIFDVKCILFHGFWAWSKWFIMYNPDTGSSKSTGKWIYCCETENFGQNTSTQRSRSERQGLLPLRKPCDGTKQNLQKQI